MKRKMYLTMASLIFAGVLNAQSIQVVYQEQIKTPDNLKNMDDPAIAAVVKAQLEKMNKTMVLYYDKGESLYKQLTTDNDAQSMQGNISVQTVQINSGGSYYKSQKDKKSIAQEYIVDRAFLITEPLRSEWQLLPEEKNIGNYKCKKATNSKNATAWYCPEIPISDGPYLYQGLPGLILEVDIPGKIITMQNIEFDAIVKDKILSPKTGKKISREEYIKTLEKKSKDLGASGKNPVSIIKM
jgi:GLPGLI family protein